MESNSTELDLSSNPFENTSVAARNLIELVKQASQIRMSQILGGARDLTVGISPTPSISPSSGHWMSFNLIVGPQFRLMLKFFYNSSTIVGMASDMLKAEPFQGKIEPFVRRYCISLVQLITASFERHELDATYCAPVILQSFDDVFYPPSSYPKIVDTGWTLTRGTHTVTFALTLEITEPDILKKLRQLSKDLENFANVVDFVETNFPS